MHNGVIGQWVATRLRRSSENSTHGPERRGTILNLAAAEQLVSRAKTIEETNATLNPPATLGIGASARMSIRMKLGGKISAKRSKSASQSNANSDNEGESLHFKDLRRFNQLNL